MSEFKGSKGNWHIIGNNGIHDNKGVCLAIATTDGILSDTECNANAQLIASSPELLFALRMVLPMAKGWAANHDVGANKEMVELAEAAINKALSK